MTSSPSLPLFRLFLIESISLLTLRSADSDCRSFSASIAAFLSSFSSDVAFERAKSLKRSFSAMSLLTSVVELLIICVGGRVRDRNFIFRVDEKDVGKNCQEISRVQREGIEKCFFRRRECASIVKRIFFSKKSIF